MTNKFSLYLKETDANEDCNTKGILCTIIYEQCEVCALAVQAAIDSNVKLFKVCGDSALVIHQLRGE